MKGTLLPQLPPRGSGTWDMGNLTAREDWGEELNEYPSLLHIHICNYQFSLLTHCVGLLFHSTWIFLGFLFLTYEFRFLSYYSSHPLPSPFPKSLAFHIPYLHIQTVFLFFSWVTYPYFHWLCISFLLLCVRSRSLLGHIKFWPALSYFLNIKMKSSCAPRKVA